MQARFESSTPTKVSHRASKVVNPAASLTDTPWRTAHKGKATNGACFIHIRRQGGIDASGGYNLPLLAVGTWVVGLANKRQKAHRTAICVVNRQLSHALHLVRYIT
jgi:hypothetical protein